MNPNWLVYQGENPRVLCVQLMAEEEASFLEDEITYLKENYTKNFSFLAYPVTKWNKELSPWPAKAIFGKEDFEGQGLKTLQEVEKIVKDYEMPVILGGYSLAGLFSLWAGYKSKAFTGLACASPSVWYEDWDAFVKSNTMQAKFVYLSLGTKEEKTKNVMMQKVGANIILQQSLLIQQGITNTLEWNEGNHFANVPLRIEKAFGWCFKQWMEGEN